MNIGIDFNTKNMKATVLDGGSNIEASPFFEMKNILTFTGGDIFVGCDGFNKFLTEQEAVTYDLNQILELNGIIIDKNQVSVERCLSLLFSALLEKAKSYAGTKIIDFVCITIPYDKFYFWHDVIPKAFLLIGIQKVRVISQPAAFFGQPDINHLHGSLVYESLQREKQKSHLYSQAFKKYKDLPWYKKLLSRKPEHYGGSKDEGHLFVSISQDNTNVSLVDYGEDVLEIISTQYSDTITRKKVERSVLDYFLSEIRKDPHNFATKEPKTLLRILEIVNEFLKTTQNSDTFEVNLPYVLCEDGKYRTLDIKIDLDALRSFLDPIFRNLAETIKKLALKTQEAQKEYKYQRKIGNVIIVCDSFIQQNIKEILSKVFDEKKVVFGVEKSLTIGALNFSRVMTGENRNFLALEVIPFSVLVRLKGGEFVEMIKKDSVIPTTSKEHSFEIKGESKSKFVEIHLTTKEGDVFQSLNVWKIEAPNIRVFKITVDIEANMQISLNAHSENGQKLSVQKGNTFSFSGAGFEVGIKGKDIHQYILNQFNYLNAVSDNKEITIFEPDETFYSMLRDGDPFKALRYLGHFLKLKSLPDIEITDSKLFEEQGINGFISGSKISVPKSFKEDPYGFGYVLVHELAHYILIHEEGIILDDEQENEILAEIFVIYMGTGKLFLNGFKSKDITPHSRGYLDEKLIQYIHQIYFNKFNINIAEYQKNLTNEGKKLLSKIDKM